MSARPPHNGESLAPDALPHEPRAEENVLASLLQYGPGTTPLDVLTQLSPPMFLDGAHRAIFEALGRLHADRAPCTVGDVADALRKAKMPEVSARAFEMGTTVGALPVTSGGFSGEVTKLAEAAGRREALAVAGRLRAGSLNGTEVADLLAGARADLAAIEENGAVATPRPMVEFLRPSALSAFTPPEGWNIVGDYHVQRTAPFVFGGPPGTGKSRGMTALAVAGATGLPWFGLPVHRRFRTMILQCENGRVRLKNETADLPEGLDEWVRISPPPPFGFAFSDPAFLRQLRDAVDEFQPDVFALDPWNRLARDDKGKDYKEAFEAIISALPPGDDCPAIGIVAHTRKPTTGERANGRALLNLLAGSYVLGSVPRSAFILQPASDEETDDRVVFSVAKNNDGALGAASAWQRRNGLFAPCEDFDWDEFNAGPENAIRSTVTEEHLDVLFAGGKTRMTTGEAVRLLMEQTKFKKTACYTALKPGGRFGTRLVESSGLLRWKGAVSA